MRIELRELNCLVFMDAALALDNFIIDNKPDMEKVYDCSELLFDLASERQDTGIVLTMHSFLKEVKIANVRRVCELTTYFDVLGDMMIKAYLRPDNVGHDNLAVLRGYCLGMNRTFSDEQANMWRRRRLVV